jgi:hypothetical protein
MLADEIIATVTKVTTRIYTGVLLMLKLVYLIS